MNLTRFDPFRELEEMSTRLGSMLGRSFGRSDIESFGDWSPALDVQESDAEYLVKADLPDMTKENVKVGIEDGVLTIEGERKQEKEETTKKYHRLERAYGKFVRRLTVPSDVDEAKVAAEFKNGVLNVHLPKAAAARPRTVQVNVA
jgi:HSP20 family protein